MDVNESGAKTPMTKKALDDDEVGTVFQKVGGETVPQSVNRGSFGDSRLLLGFREDLLDSRCGNRLVRILARQEPPPGVGNGLRPVPLQGFVQPPGKHDIAVTFPLALPNVDHHAFAVDIGYLQVTNLIEPQAARVDRHEDGPVLDVGGGLQQGEHFFFIEHHRQPFLFTLAWHPFDVPLLLQRHVVKELKGRHRLVEVTG